MMTTPPLAARQLRPATTMERKKGTTAMVLIVPNVSPFLPGVKKVKSLQLRRVSPQPRLLLQSRGAQRPVRANPHLAALSARVGRINPRILEQRGSLVPWPRKVHNRGLHHPLQQMPLLALLADGLPPAREAVTARKTRGSHH